MISQDEVTTNGDTKRLPYKAGMSAAPPGSSVGHGPTAGGPLSPCPLGNITVFRQTSTHLQMATTFGLELVIRLRPVFQVYITLGPHFRGQTKGEPLLHLPRVSRLPCPHMARPHQRRRGTTQPRTDLAGPARMASGQPLSGQPSRRRGQGRPLAPGTVAGVQGRMRTQAGPPSWPGLLRALWQLQRGHDGRLHDQHGHRRGHRHALRGLLAGRELPGRAGARDRPLLHEPAQQ